MHQRSVWSTCGIAIILATTAHAGVLDLAQIEDVEALSLEDLLERPVVAATRYAQKPGGSPTLVSSVDRELIEGLGYRTVGEALRGMRGVYLRNDRTYGYLGVRGFGVPGDFNTRLALSIDNHRVNDAIYSQASPGAELGLPMIAVDRVEMLRGGAWPVYGQNALLGAIHIVTATGESRPGLHVESKTTATAETYSDPANRPAFAPRAQDVAASYGGVFGMLDVFAAASYQRDAGLSALYMPELAGDRDCVDTARRPQLCDGVVRGGDGEEAGGAYLSLRRGRLSGHALASRRRKLVLTAPNGQLVGVPSEIIDDRVFADAAYTIARERTDFEARVGADYYHFHGANPYSLPREGYEALPESMVVNVGSDHGVSIIGELRGRYKWPRRRKQLSDLEIAAGAELTAGHASMYNFDPLPEGPVVYRDTTVSSRTAALSVSTSGRAFGHLVGLAAVRADYYPDGFGLSVNPQGGLVLDGGDLGRIRASISRGLRAPNAFETSVVEGPDAAPGSTPLGPERSESREISVERYLGKHARLLAIAYTQRMRDLVVVSEDLTRFVNAGAARSTGVELELEARWDAVQLRACINRQRAYDQDGQPMINSPRSVGAVSLMLPLGRRARLAAETHYIGSRLGREGTAVEAAFLTSAALTLPDVIDQLDLTLGANNLFDVRTADTGGEEHAQLRIPGDPRTVWLRLSLELPQ